MKSVGNPKSDLVQLPYICERSAQIRNKHSIPKYVSVLERVPFWRPLFSVVKTSICLRNWV